MTLAAGSKLGPYEIVARIGAGGMGEVWKARDTRLDRTVAIKCLSERYAVRFEQEARAIAALNHPHICQIFDVGPDYLVLEYVSGKPLRGPLPTGDSLRLAAQIASALEEAHRRGILHRDLKPDNVIVTEAGAKLLDFGLAKFAPIDTDMTRTVTGALAGTPAYMSPEQARGQALDARSDIFSFGVLLYELLSGKRAFAGETLLEILNSVTTSDAMPLDTPAWPIVNRCLAKDPSQRFQTALELKQALESVLAKVSVAEITARAGSPNLSIAVLPFANMSGDREQEYFSDGLTEEIINALANVPRLKVIARTSAFAFKGQNVDIRKIAETLGVANVLEGSVRRAGNRIRVTAQLIEASDGSHLWSERYDRQMEDIFAVQDEISAAIASALKLKLSPESAGRRRYQPNLRAYEAYLKYRHYLYGFTPDSLRLSRLCLDEAIALDPEFALPYVGLADNYLALTVIGTPPAEAIFLMRQAAMRALELDPDLPDAHAMLGILAGPCNLDWAEANRRFHLATAREPVPAHIRIWHSAFHLLPLGRLHEAHESVLRALEDDPLDKVTHWNLSIVLQSLGRQEEALAALRHTLELDPSFSPVLEALAIYYSTNGRIDEARECAEKAFSIAPLLRIQGLLAGVLRRAGDISQSQSLLESIPTGIRGAMARFDYHLACAEFDAAVEQAAAMIDDRQPTASFQIRSNAHLLSRSSQWPALIAKFNLT